MSRRRPGFFRVIRYDKTVRGSHNALTYVAFRSEDVKGKTPDIFDERSDHADVDRFARNLDQRVTRHASSAKAYHCLFSMKRSDFDQAGMTNFREMVREVMHTYELETRRRLEWIASFHNNQEHPHCHVVIRASYTNENGREKKLFLNRSEVQRIKEITGRAIEARLPMPERPPPKRVFGPRAPSLSRAVGGVFQWIEQQIKEDRRRRQREEAERYRWLAQQEREERGR